jgi:ribonuclease P protein component
LRPAQKTAHFVLYTCVNQLPHARLGVVVAKRFAPRAATRNTIKRMTRELFRQSRLPAIDCVVRLSKAVNGKDGPATSASLKAALRVELLRLFATPLAQARSAAAAAATAGTTTVTTAADAAAQLAAAVVPATQADTQASAPVDAPAGTVAP